MSVNTETQSVQGQTTVLDKTPQKSVYASLFEKINLTPVKNLGDITNYQDTSMMAEASADERVTAGIQVFMQVITQSGQKVEKLDKTLLDQHIAELDRQISRQLDEVMHHPEFQRVEGLWRGLKHTVDRTDFRQNVKVEILDVSKDDLRQDFEDSPEIIQSGLYYHTYTMEYDQPGGEPIAAIISSYEFDASAQDVALLRNISKVSAAAHMPFTGPRGMCLCSHCTLPMRVCIPKPMGAPLSACVSNAQKKWTGAKPGSTRLLFFLMPKARSVPPCIWR